jgi:hypothetical protein
MKQTALDILFHQIKLKADSIPTNTAENRKVKGAYVDCLTLIREAKEMEKEQIIDANIAGMEFIPVDPNKHQEDAEQYYNEIFKINEK